MERSGAAGVAAFVVNPWLAGNVDLDSDGDGLSDFQETHKYLTDPYRADSDGDGVPDGDANERREYTYSIRNRVEVLKPINLDAMNSDLQDTILVEDKGASVILDVVAYPLNTASSDSGETRGWRAAAAAQSELAPFLSPGQTVNFDKEFHDEVLRELAEVGMPIEALERVSDREVVRLVSEWVVSTWKDGSPFTAFYVEYEPTLHIPTEFEPVARAENPTFPAGELQHFAGQGVLGKDIYSSRKRGSCTSSAILMATVMRIVGIPARLVMTIPPVDVNEPRQLGLIRNGVTHHQAFPSRSQLSDVVRRTEQAKVPFQYYPGASILLFPATASCSGVSKHVPLLSET